MANGDSKLSIFKLDARNCDELEKSTGYDVQFAVVVVAADETRARQIAADNAGDEGVYVWAFKASVMTVGTAGKDLTEGLVVRDYRAS